MPEASSIPIVVPVIFDVSKAYYETGILRDPNITFGKEREVTGTIPRVRLEVESAINVVSSTRCPVRVLEFKGFCNIQAGDRIRTYIKKCTQRGNGGYVERDYLHVEGVSRIEKLNLLEILADFRGVDKFY